MVKEVISSAGIVYLYLNGYKENNKLYIQPVDTYHYMGEGFYRKVMENAAVDDQDDSVAHIFAIVGKKDKVKQIYALFENSLNENFKRIVAGKHIQKSLDMLDTTGNFFFQCVQEFFCEQLSHFPKRIDYDCEDFVVNGICCSHLANGDGDSLVDEMLSLWLNREKPALCGKQLMTQSFFLCDFVGRKVIASIPEMDTASWRFIFEGGHQLSLDAERPYSKETLHPSDLGQFCSSNMQSILMNPIYAYGVWLQPNDICEEWHKAFLYLCAVSDIDWDRACFLKIYETFLTFLKKNICVAMDTSPFISKELYCDALLIHVQHFLDFLKGEDEPVLSKDLHQTMNSRYVYLPYLWPLLSQKPCIKEFSETYLKQHIDQAMQEKDTYKKGILWEDVAAYVLENVSGWKLTGRRIRAGAQEIDISVANVSLDNPLWELGAYILVECKNWSSHVDIHQIRNIAHVSNLKGNKTAILFATNGITADAQNEIIRLVTENCFIICITADDLKQVSSADDCKNLILKQWHLLESYIEVSSML